MFGRPQSLPYFSHKSKVGGTAKALNHMISILLFLVFLQSPSLNEGATFFVNGAMVVSRETTAQHFRLYNSGGGFFLAHFVPGLRTPDRTVVHLHEQVVSFDEHNFAVLHLYFFGRLAARCRRGSLYLRGCAQRKCETYPRFKN
jgi:hypothetical protein